MRLYNLKFSDQRTCRCIVMEPKTTTDLDRHQVINNFQPGHVVSIERIIPEIPEKLPWKRCGDHWEIEGFALHKDADGAFSLHWRGGSLTSVDKGVISQAVRDNWSSALA